MFFPPGKNFCAYAHVCSLRHVSRQLLFAGADTGGGGYGGSSPPPSRKWAGLQCAHAQRHVITIGLYTLNRCFWRVFRAATDQGRI